MWAHHWGVSPVAHCGTTAQVLCMGKVSSRWMSWAGSPPEHIQTCCRERRGSEGKHVPVPPAWVQCVSSRCEGNRCCCDWGTSQLFHPSHGHLQLFFKDFFWPVLQHNMALLPPAVLQPTIRTPFLHDSQCSEKLVVLWGFLLMSWLTLTTAEWIQFFSHYPLLLEAFPFHALLLHTFPAWFLWQH